MPYLKLSTNVEIVQPQELLAELSQLVAGETGKPERYVMVEVAGGQTMLFAGSDQPLVYVECKSIGLSSSQARVLSATLTTVLASRLAVATDRVYIEFSNAPAEFWGWNGSTFG